LTGAADAKGPAASAVAPPDAPPAGGGPAGGGPAAPGGKPAGKPTDTDKTDDITSLILHPPGPPPRAGDARPPLRPARLSGDRDWVIYVECRADGVVVYPSQLLVSAATLARASGSNPLQEALKQMIDRRQATVRPGEPPYRPEVRFLVRPDALKTFHLAYPAVDGLPAEKKAQNLGPDEDAAAVIAGH
jgi:hypothetical protein